MKRASHPQSANLFDPESELLDLPPSPPPPPPPLPEPPKKRRVPSADKPGTRLGKNVTRVSAVRSGKRFFMGILDTEKRIYQRGLTLDRYLFQPFGEPLYMTFGLKDEWYKIRNAAGSIEHLDVDHQLVDDYRVYVVPMWVAKRVGQTIETRWGRRWGIPLSAFDVITREGVVEIAGRPR